MLKTQRSKLTRVALRVQNRALVSALDAWLAFVGERARLRSLLKRLENARRLARATAVVKVGAIENEFDAPTSCQQDHQLYKDLCEVRNVDEHPQRVRHGLNFIQDHRKHVRARENSYWASAVRDSNETAAVIQP